MYSCTDGKYCVKKALGYMISIVCSDPDIFRDGMWWFHL